MDELNRIKMNCASSSDESNSDDLSSLGKLDVNELNTDNNDDLQPAETFSVSETGEIEQLVKQMTVCSSSDEAKHNNSSEHSFDIDFDSTNSVSLDEELSNEYSVDDKYYQTDK